MNCIGAPNGAAAGPEEGTVRNYLSAAIAKTGVRNRVEAYRAAQQRGW
jgi:DNA-binding NarL/FixJ family response regulator